MTFANPILNQIALHEGYGTANAPSITSGNNPGAIQYGAFAISQGATGKNPNGTAFFPDLATGTAAANNLIGQYLAGGYVTPAAFVSRWTGLPMSDSQNYAASLATGLGIGLDSSLTGVGTGGDPGTVLPLDSGSGSFGMVTGGMGSVFGPDAILLAGLVAVAAWVIWGD